FSPDSVLRRDRHPFPTRRSSDLGAMFTARRTTTHRDHDDLLTAGLGLDGLRIAPPPRFADPARPTAVELRRRALWSSWRGIADRSEEHTSELQSRENLVCRLLLE